MKKLLPALLGCWVFAMASIAADDRFNDVPDTYTVKKGDTLWHISEHFLKTPWLWPEIWYVNPQIRNPHLIYPGDTIKLVYIDGKPYLMLERGDRVVKLSPQIRELPNDRAIDAIPLDAINNFLSRTRVVEEGVLEAAPYVVAGSEKRLLSGKDDDFYARGSFDETPVYGIYRKGDLYLDPNTKEVLGVRAVDIGSAKLKVVDGDIATLLSSRAVEEIRVGDRLLPHEERRLESMFFPTAPEQEVEGVIMAVEGGISQVGNLDVVAINLGERDGMAVGTVLAIYKRGATVTDRIAKEKVTLPDERAGLLMVFRAFEKMSFGLVLKAQRPLAVDDLLKNP